MKKGLFATYLMDIKVTVNIVLLLSRLSALTFNFINTEVYLQNLPFVRFLYHKVIKYLAY